MDIEGLKRTAKDITNFSAKAVLVYEMTQVGGQVQSLQAADISSPETHRIVIDGEIQNYDSLLALEPHGPTPEPAVSTPEPTPLPQNYESASGLSSEIALFDQATFESYIDSVKPLLSPDEQNQLSQYLQNETLRHDSLAVNSIIPNSGSITQVWELMQNNVDNSLVITGFSVVSSADVEVVRSNGTVKVPEGSALFAYTTTGGTPDVAVLTPGDGQKIGAYPTNETGINAGAQFVTYSSEGGLTTIFDTLGYSPDGSIQQVSAQEQLSADGKLVGGIKVPAYGFGANISGSLIAAATKADQTESQTASYGNKESYAAAFAQLPQELQSRTALPDTDPQYVSYDEKRFGFVNSKGQVWRHGTTPADKDVEAGWMNQTDEYTTPNTNTRFVLETDPKGVGYKDRNHKLVFTPLMKEHIEAALNIKDVTNGNKFQNETIIIQFVSDFDLQASLSAGSDYLHAFQTDDKKNVLTAFKIRDCGNGCRMAQIFTAGNIWEKEHPDWYPDQYWFSGSFAQALKAISDGPSVAIYDSLGGNYNGQKLNKVFTTFGPNPDDYLIAPVK